MKVDMLGFAENMSRSRTDTKTLGKQYSFIVFGSCNFRCKYCFMGGYEKRKSDRMPGAKRISLNVVRKFIAEQIAKGYIIRITGGEPTLYPKALRILVQDIKRLGGYVSLSTNGSNPSIVESLFPLIDEINLGLKGIPPEVETLTGASHNECWIKPIQLLKKLKKYVGNIQVNQVVWQDTTAQELEEIAQHIPKNGTWRIKSFVPVKHRFDYNGNCRTEYSSHFCHKPMEKTKIGMMTKKLQVKYPHLKIITTNNEAEKRIGKPTIYKMQGAG